MAAVLSPREPAQIINQSVQAVSVVHKVNEKRLQRIEQRQRDFMQLAKIQFMAAVETNDFKLGEMREEVEVSRQLSISRDEIINIIRTFVVDP